MTLYSETFYSQTANNLLSESNFLKQMLRVESALAQAQARANHIPMEAAAIISASCKVQYIDMNQLKGQIPFGGNAAIPLVKQLTKVVKTNNFEASKFVHLGATSQDIIDTASVLQIKAYTNWLLDQCNLLEEKLRLLTEKHRSTLMIGRTLMQQAKPITFGLKTALWLKSVRQAKVRIIEGQKRLLVTQLSGAVGSGNRHLSKEIRVHFNALLDLENTDYWQSDRGNLNEFAANLGILSGSLGKMARDISILMQTEIAEVLEGAKEGKGGSSTMPHKRNPVNCALIISNTTRTPHLVATMLSSMMQENERSAGLWHTEWETLASIMLLTAGSLEKAIELVEHLEVDSARMLENLELTKGLIYAENVSLALAAKIGKMQAHEIVEKACKAANKENKHLKEIVAALNLEFENLDELFKPENSIGNSIEILEEIISNK